MNKVILLGRLVRDAELRKTASGASVCAFSIACDRPYTQDGERKADFIACVAWRQQAEFIGKYFRKGDRIALDGSIQTRSWDDQNGNKRYATEVIIDHAEFAQAKSERGGQAPAMQGQATAPTTATQTPAGDAALPDSDFNDFCAGALESDLPF